MKMNGKKLSKFQFHFPELPRTSLMLKHKTKKKRFDNWTLEIIPFIRYLIQMDRTERVSFFGGKCLLLIVIQLCYNELWQYSH
jgi:hypothetical protein